MDHTETLPQKKTIGILILLLAIAIFLRFFHLGFRSLWMDEAYTVWLANHSIGELFQLLRTDTHPPLVYLFVHFWEWWGRSEAYLRAPSALLGVLNVLFVFLLGEKLFGRSVGIIAACFWTFSYLAIDFETQVRWYAYAIFAMLAATYAFWRALQSGTRKSWLLYITLMAVSIYVVYFCALVYVAHATVLIAKRRTLAFWGTLLSLIFLGLPGLFIFWSQTRGERIPFPRTYLADLPNMIAALTGTYPFLRSASGLSISIVLVAIATILLSAYASIRLRRERHDALLLVLSLLLFTFALPFSLALCKLWPYQLRYLIFPAPFVFMLIAAGILNSRTGLLLLLPVSICFLFVNGSLWFFGRTSYAYELQNWRLAASTLNERLQSGDSIIVDAFMSIYPLAYYLPNRLQLIRRGESNFIEDPSPTGKVYWYPISNHVPLPAIMKAASSSKRKWLVLCQDAALSLDRKTLREFSQAYQAEEAFRLNGEEPIEIYRFGIPLKQTY